MAEPNYPETEYEVIGVVKDTKYSDLRQARAEGNAEKFATEFVLKTLKKRLFSSPAAFAASLEQHEKSLYSARRSGSEVSAAAAARCSAAAGTAAAASAAPSSARTAARMSGGGGSSRARCRYPIAD